MTAGSAAGLGAVKRASAARDVVKALCIGAKLTRNRQATAAARERLSSLKAAVEAGDAARASREYTTLVEQSDLSNKLGGEASACVGDQEPFVGDTAVKTTIDPIPPADQALPEPPDLFQGPPPLAPNLSPER